MINIYTVMPSVRLHLEIHIDELWDLAACVACQCIQQENEYPE